MRRFAFVLLMVLLPVRAGAAPRADRRVERLAQVAKVWGTIRWVHPYVFERDVDWDAALVAAIQKVNAADADDEYASAVGAMLDALHDPLTHVVARSSETRSNEPPKDSRPAF